jgi:hypothetical protein
MADTFEYRFMDYRGKWRFHSLFIPTNWIVGATPRGRRCEVTLNIGGDWDVPLAAAAYCGGSFDFYFQNGIWLRTFSLLVPTSWIVRVRGLSRGVLVRFDLSVSPTAPLAADCQNWGYLG